MTDSRFTGERTNSQKDLGEELETNGGSLTSNGYDEESARWTIQQMRERNSRVPINQLPTELLAIVFHISLERVKNRFKGLQTIARVAWWWQSIVKGTPNLWAVLDWRIPPQHLPVFIQRSKGAPLRFTMNDKISFTNSSGDGTAFLDMVLSELDRWEEGRLILKYGQSDRQGRLERPAPLLKTFYVEHYTSVAQHGHQIDLFQGHAPNLVELMITRLPIRWNSAIFRNLLSISICGVTSNCPTVQEVLQSILSSPRLQSFSLKESRFSPSPFLQEILPIEIPHLKTLIFSQVPHSPIEFVLSRTRAPALRKLVVQPRADSERHPLVGFLNTALFNFEHFIASSISNAQKLRITADGSSRHINVTTSGSFDENEGIKLLFYHQPVITGLQPCLEFLLRNVPVCPPLSLMLLDLPTISESDLLRILDGEINDKVTELSVLNPRDDSLLVFLCKARYLDGVAKWALPKLKSLVLPSRGWISSDRMASLLRQRYAPDPVELSASLKSDPLPTLILEEPDRLEFFHIKGGKVSRSDFENLCNIVGAGVMNAAV